MAALALGLVLSAGAAIAADEGSRERVFENAYVVVDRITLAPGEALARHAGEDRVVYSLSDYTIRWTEAGEPETRSWRMGDVHRHEALDHAVENTGSTVAEYLVVARTGEPLPATAVEADASQIEGGYAALLGSFEGTRVLRVGLPAGARQPMHDGGARLVYTLNDQQLVYFTGDDAEGQKTAHAAGTFHWHEAGRHAVENAGTTTARYVLFAFE